MMKRRMFQIIALIFFTVIIAPVSLAADQVDQQNVGAMPPPLGDDNYGIAGVSYGLWEGQTITPQLKIMTGVDFAVLAANHGWNTLPVGTRLEARVYGNSGGLPATLLATADMNVPVSPNGPSYQIFTYKFTFGTPVDLSAYVGLTGSITIALCVPNNVSGELNTLYSPGTYYAGGNTLVSYNQGASWSMNTGRDQMFHTYAAFDGLKYYGYYEEEDGRFGYFGPETYPYTNFIHLAPLAHDFFKKRMAEAVANGQRIFLDTGALFQSQPEENWDDAFIAYANMVRPYVNHVAAVFVIDEPFTSDGSGPNPPYSFNTEQVEHMIRVIESNLPGVKTVINFIAASTDHWACPNNIDYVGTTFYPWGSPNAEPLQHNGPATYADFRSQWEDYVGKVRTWADGKPLWVWSSGAQGIPGVLPNPPYAGLLVYPTATEAQWYRDILSEPNNSDVIGFSWYTYTNEYTWGCYASQPDNEPYQTGSRLAPAALKEFQENWGWDIGDLPYLGTVSILGSQFDVPLPYNGSRDTAMGIKNDAWFSSPLFTGQDAYNISGISLKQMAGTAPSLLTLKLYKMPLNNYGENRPTYGTLITTQQWDNPVFNTDDTFTFLPFDEPVAAQAIAKYVYTLESSDTALWYVWGSRVVSDTYNRVCFSSNQSATWTQGFPDQGFFTNYEDARILYRAWMREDYNPPIDWNQDAETWGRSLEYTDWVGQTFVPRVNNITGFAFGGAGRNVLVMNGGTVYARLYLANATHKPTGSPIVSMAVPVEDLGGFPRFDFGQEIAVTPGQEYVATMEVYSAGTPPTGDWQLYYSISSFSGYCLHSTNQGATWSYHPSGGGIVDWKFRTFFNPPETLCGDTRHPYPAGDLNKDCYVDYHDVDTLAENWLHNDCGDVYSWCYGADADRSGKVNLVDFSIVAESWVECTSPNSPCNYNNP